MTLHISSKRVVLVLSLVVLSVYCSPRLQAADPIPLRAGPLTLLFEPDNAFLRYVKLGPHEVLRGINAPIRNQFWGTVQPKVTNVKLNNQENHFTLEFDADCQERDVHFFWHGTIRGTAAGELELIFDGVARSSFMRNRIGFCVLHGPTAAGRPWVVESPAGKTAKGTFPTYISPHQPAKDIRTITHEVTDDIWARIQFTGDTFETEDQRNWTDASFKTYCTPLAIPYPVQVNKGDKVHQRIQLSIEGNLDNIQAQPQESNEPIQLNLGSKKSPLPKIGLQVSSEVDTLSKIQIQRLQALKLNHLHVKLVLSDENFAAKLRKATRQANALKLNLHTTLQLGENPADELTQLAQTLKKIKPPITVCLINEADKELFRIAHKHLKPLLGDALLGTSQDTNYVELNRARPTDELVQVVSYGINPQIHAIDNASIIETLPIQGVSVQSAKQFIGNRKLVVGPITFRPQPINQQPASGELPANVDTRQPSLFVAGWTLGSIQSLAEANTKLATYYESVGWKGILEAEEIPSQRPKFPSQPGQVYAVYHVFRNLADFSEGNVIQLDSSDPLSVVALALTDGNHTRLLVANLTKHEKTVSITDLNTKATLQSLTSKNSSEANLNPEAFHNTPGSLLPQGGPLSLPPFAILRIDY